LSEGREETLELERGQLTAPHAADLKEVTVAGAARAVSSWPTRARKQPDAVAHLFHPQTGERVGQGLADAPSRCSKPSNGNTVAWWITSVGCA
jgi:hypothetical protein